VQVLFWQLSLQSAPASHVALTQPVPLLSQSMLHVDPTLHVTSRPEQSAPFWQLKLQVLPSSHVKGSSEEHTLPSFSQLKLQVAPVHSTSSHLPPFLQSKLQSASGLHTAPAHTLPLLRQLRLQVLPVPHVVPWHFALLSQPNVHVPEHSLSLQLDPEHAPSDRHFVPGQYVQAVVDHVQRSVQLVSTSLTNPSSSQVAAAGSALSHSSFAPTAPSPQYSHVDWSQLLSVPQ
jgi:hypothetical protein